MHHAHNSHYWDAYEIHSLKIIVDWPNVFLFITGVRHEQYIQYSQGPWVPATPHWRLHAGQWSPSPSPGGTVRWSDNQLVFLRNKSWMYLCLCQGKYTWFWLGALMFYLLECADALWYFPFERNQILSVNIGFQYVNEFKKSNSCTYNSYTICAIY